MYIVGGYDGRSHEKLLHQLSLKFLYWIHQTESLNDLHVSSNFGTTAMIDDKL